MKIFNKVKKASGFLNEAKNSKIIRAERKLRYSVVQVLDQCHGDISWVEDVVSEAYYDWGIVNE